VESSRKIRERLTHSLRDRSPKRTSRTGGSRAKEAPSLLTRMPPLVKDFTPEQLLEAKVKYLTAYAQTGNRGAACKAARVSRRYVDKVWRAEATIRKFTDEEYAEAEVFKELEKEALENAVDLLEAEAVRRARDGYNKPIVFQGKVVSTYKEYSDSLMQMLLRAHRPEKFRDNLNLSNSDGSLAAAFAAAVKGVADEVK
jgi:hypothetical protein